jgi:hypothetical protein
VQRIAWGISHAFLVNKKNITRKYSHRTIILEDEGMIRRNNNISNVI